MPFDGAQTTITCGLQLRLTHIVIHIWAYIDIIIFIIICININAPTSHLHPSLAVAERVRVLLFE